MKTLILTEKPSVARDFSVALRTSQKREGYFEGPEYIITWAVGHLMELKDPGEYHNKWKAWSLGSLPILPDRLQYKAKTKTQSQLRVILKQLGRADIARVVLATDAGREGELIGRALIREAKVSRPVFRFWTSQALSAKVIQTQLQQMKPLKDYDRLYYAGRARQSADWLVGMNLSRLATIRMGELFSVGRVQTAVLALLVRRRREIDNFKPEPYFLLEGLFQFSMGKVTAFWFDPQKKIHKNRLKTESQANEILSYCKNKDVVVAELKKEKKSLPSPQLYSLTELQKVANRAFGFSAKKTLSIAQTLYERQKCISYPRTDARVLGTESLNQVKELLENFQKESRYREDFKYFVSEKVNLSHRRVFNNEKLTDHHALIPLKTVSLNGDDLKIYELIRKRFIMVFSKDFCYEETRAHFKIEKENFQTKGQRVLTMGWRALEGGRQDTLIPELTKGEKGNVESLKRVKKMTIPPFEYSEATLLQDMINPAKWVDGMELKRIFRGEVGLGTQATRAQIIETLLSRQYIERRQKHLIALSKGMQLIDNFGRMAISKSLISPEETAQWELDLEKISQGTGDPRSFMERIRKFVAECAEEWKSAEISKVPKTRGSSGKTSGEKSLGQCPLCKGDVIESKKSYCCENWRENCKFTIWKQIAGKKISEPQVKKILKSGKSDSLKGFKSKNGKSFSAKLKLKEKGVAFAFTE